MQYIEINGWMWKEDFKALMLSMQEAADEAIEWPSHYGYVETISC
jgi:hypothetical protein